MWHGQQGVTSRRAPLGVSLALHVLAFLALMEAPGIELPRTSESEYKQAISGKEDKIVWYKFPKALPHVTPPAANQDKRPLRADSVASQAMVSAPKDAPKRDRMVFVPTPPVAAPQPLESPNLLAIKLPDQPFVTPPDLVRPAPARVDVPDAPELKPVETASAQVTVRLPPKPFAAPNRPPRIPAVMPLAPEAPQLSASLAPAGSLPGNPAKLPARPFTAPPSAGSPARNSEPILEGPPKSQDLNLAVVGLNPLERTFTLPSAPSPAAFSAGPKINPEGATAEGAGKGVIIPDLFVRGDLQNKPTPNKPGLLAEAYAAPTSAATLRAAMRGATNNGELVTDLPPAAALPRPATATKVSGAPDPRFNGRDVYMMAIQMPNLTSYSGSWLMWYADRTLRESGLAPVAAPVPHRKVDPKYLPAAIAEGVEGNVTLGCVVDREGKVSGVELIRGADSRLVQSAAEALSKWLFYPATRNGVPVEVDVLVEIPFRLAPKTPRR